ncbi:MAG: phosphatase family protein [Patescibacteria group bacterium]|nr:phosphatase family protein [Patescibacteria group bacterium]
MNSIIIFCAKYLFLIAGLVAVIYWLRVPKPQKIQLLIFAAIAGVVAFVLTRIGGALYYDPRPFMTSHTTPLIPHAPGNGFPSDHTVLAALIAVVIYSASKRLGLVLFALALAVGAARVAAQVHSPIDILGSMVFAVMGGLAAYYLTPKVTARLNKKAPTN